MKTTCIQCPQPTGSRRLTRLQPELCAACFAGWIKAIQRDLRLDRVYSESDSTLDAFEILEDLRHKLGLERYQWFTEDLF